ncbi:hypothetical protein VKT23_015061, partial [Stygiomarasmius scandens]
MFSKTLLPILLLAISSLHSVAGHALMTPALGVSGEGERRDVQRLQRTGPSCGEVDVAANMATSTPAMAAADGTFTVTATNFNRRTDGSRQVTATVDPSGTGNSFAVPATVTKNGDPAPRQLGSEPVTVQLPADMSCTGGANGNMCLVSFVTLSGFGNCVVVDQSAQKAANAVGAGAASASGVSNATGATDASVGSTSVAGTDASGVNTGATGIDTASAGTGVAETDAGIDTTASSGVSGSDAGIANVQGANTGLSSAPAPVPAQGGTRAARALLAALRARGLKDFDFDAHTDPEDRAAAGLRTRALKNFDFDAH